MAELLKHAYDETYIQRLADALKAAGGQIKKEEFCDAVFAEEWDELELKERMRKIRGTIHDQLALPYKEATEILMIAARGFGGFEGMLFPDYVQVHGLDSWGQSMKTLSVLTTFSSSEFAIRPFISQNQVKAMKQLLSWSKNKNFHVRRLASEGCRPRLPWAPALPELKKDPSSIIPILENLITDESLYVRKSVANNLNDISKDHPQLAISLGKKWIKNANPDTRWIVKHGLRGLLKKGEKSALGLFGYGSPSLFTNHAFQLESPLVVMEENLEFSFSFTLKKKCSTRLEYALYFLKKNGSHTKKVFKLSEKEMVEGEHYGKKCHHFKKINTRVYHEGLHFIELIVNGVPFGRAPFYLMMKAPTYVTYMFLTERGTIYTGVTTDLNRRFHEHRSGIKGAKYTKANKPEKLIFLEAAANRSIAQKKESQLKSLSRIKKEKLSWLKDL